MAENKTKQRSASVTKFMQGVQPDVRRTDGLVLVEMIDL